MGLSLGDVGGEQVGCRPPGPCGRQHRSTQRKVPQGQPDEARLTDDIIELAREYGRYGYRMITGMLNQSGWRVNHKRVERIWKREGLKVPSIQPKKSRLWLNDGSCVRLRPERPNHVWSYDFVQDRTRDGRTFRMLNIIDEFTKEALTIRVERKLNSTDVVDALIDLFILGGPPEFIRSDNGPEFIAEKVIPASAVPASRGGFPEGCGSGSMPPEQTGGADGQSDWSS